MTKRTITINLSAADHALLIRMISYWIGDDDDAPSNRMLKRVLDELRRTR